MSDAPPDRLRSAWEELSPPPPFRELADEDAGTRASVAWLAEAYAAVTPAQPAAAPRAPRRQWRRWLPLLPLAAAAAFLLRAAAEPPLAPEPEPALAAAAVAPAAAAEAVAPAAPSSPVELIASLPDRLELRSGPVRLTLLQPHGTPSQPQP